MISIVPIKPGVLRTILAREVLRALGHYVRLFCRDGYLASMRTIHFAHWAFLDNGTRFMPHSKYDGSWEGYGRLHREGASRLDIGLDPWRRLSAEPLAVRGGASEGSKFKAWARHSMSESQFWFSAYKQYRRE